MANGKLNPEEMAQRMIDVLPAFMPEVRDKEEISRLFRTIAEGVIRHLADNPGAFSLTGTVSGGNCSGKVAAVATEKLTGGP